VDAIKQMLCETRVRNNDWVEVGWIY